MDFSNLDKNISEAEIERAEKDVGFSFPPPLRSLFLNSNGGVPDPYVLNHHKIVTTVSETLPLYSDQGFGTALDSYSRLISEQKIAPPFYLPFAVDSGGDYFFVDCTESSAPVSFYRSDCASGEPPLIDLGLGLEAFWDSLVSPD